MKPVWIVAAKRTPQGRFLGTLAGRSAVELGIAAGKAALVGVDPVRVDQVIVGNVLGAGLGMNVARQIGMGCGLPVETPAFTVNMMCASGLQAVLLAAQAVRAGAAGMVLCGGTESMSNAPYVLERARTGYKFGDGTLIDTLLRDGLTDAFSDEHMGLTAERLAQQYGISREAQDRFAADSQQRYSDALAAGHFADEVVPVDGLTHDEQPRPGTTEEKLATLRPVFDPMGTVTAGNASGLNDGAAMLLVCDEETGRDCGLTPLLRIGASAAVGCDPSVMGIGPVHAIRRLSQDPAAEFEHIELNEAFAAQSLACIGELRLDPSRVNPDGGAIALGHPLGASGARLLVHLAHRRPQKALAALCVGGGMGCAAIVERA
ncbi:MAG: acetyl-CoA C-acyltransferase [Armatimonadota bacterium]